MSAEEGLLEKPEAKEIPNDLRVHQAALYIRAAVKAQRRFRPPKGHEDQTKLVRRIEFLRPLALTAYLSVSLFEKPSWCEDDSYYFNCTVHYQGKDHEVPMSLFPKLPQRILHSFELFFILLIAGMELLRVSFRSNTKTSEVRCVLILILSLLAVADNIQVIVTQDRLYFAQFIRPVIFLLVIRAVREVFIRIFIVLKEALAVIGLILIHVSLFAWMGKILFTNTAEGDLYFSGLEDALFNMFVALTTNNYPDIMIPIVAVNGAYVLFFVIFSLLGMFFLMNILLGVFYNNYRLQIEDEARCFVEENNFDFDTLQSENIVKLLQVIVESGVKIDLKYRRKISNLLESDELKELVLKTEDPEEIEDRVINTPLAELCCATWYKSPGSCWQSAPYFMESSFYETTMNLLNTMNVLSQVILDFTTYYEYTTWWVYAQIGFLTLYWAEMTMEFALQGIARYFQSYNRALDCVLNVASASYLLYLMIEGFPDDSLTFLEFFCLFRLFRILTLLSEVPQYRIIFLTFIKLIPLFMTLFSVFLMLFYLYSLLGVEIYGGLVYPENPDIFGDSGNNIEYTYINFNDFANGLLQLFVILLQNNWPNIISLYEDVSDAPNRVFFVSFYIISVFITLNLLVAFVLDIFETQREYEKTKAELKA